ncbi:MAG: UDP-N-acetylmuramate--L-alanine ligase [Planctomycetaceae bacterium]|nr:UDP-N-acetylmuramate--L-alanine ligase [Planctomycetaceae bacterium]
MTQTNNQPAAESFTGKSIHLIGMGGCGMGALAGVLLAQGARVSGSDSGHSDLLDRLAGQGATVHIGQRGANIAADCQLVAYSAAIHNENPELVAARQRGLEVVRYSAMLGRLMAQRQGIAIAGTHGKSTTTAMVAYALKTAGLDPSYVVGATVDQLGGPSGVGSGPHFVAEACEFDRNFLDLRPRYAAILNVEEDHLDCYRDLSAIIEAFRAFGDLVAPGGVLVVNGEDRNAASAVSRARCAVETFGLTNSCTWRGVNASSQQGIVSMDVQHGGQPYCRITVPLPGLHNAYNTLAAMALLHHAGVPAESMAALLAGFTGARRRMTFKGDAGGVTVLDDYAHHPTEIAVTLRAIREHYRPQRLVCIFQPHQHSRTRFLLKDFARSFGSADEVIVPDIYFVRDSDLEKDYISSQDLVSQIRLHGGSARYIQAFDQIVEQLAQQLHSGDLVVTMGAGNIWEVADEIVRRFGRDRQG